MENLQKYIDEIIAGNDSHLEDLKNTLTNFFKDKGQSDFDKIDKAMLNQLVQIQDLINKKEPFTKIDRALLDHAFHEKKPFKYFWLKKECKLHPGRLKAFRNFIIKEIDLGEDRDDFIKWVDWIIGDEIEWDDGIYKNKQSNFQIFLDITNYENERPDLHIFMIGDKKFKKIMQESVLFLKSVD
jgi:hypothetical protein